MVVLAKHIMKIGHVNNERLCMKIVGFGGNSTPLDADIGIFTSVSIGLVRSKETVFLIF